MYSSLDKIDIVVEEPAGLVAVQTDHRKRDEIEAEPELSVLFALTRIIGARQGMQREGKPLAAVVYAAFDEPPALLVEALAAAEAQLEVMPQKERRALPAANVDVATLVERAFSGLAARVARRTGLTDVAASLHALEAEVLADPPDQDEDEVTYWTRVLELAAMVVAVIRTRHPGDWTVTDQSDLPFALSLGGGHLLLPGNRARRFLADGAAESMFLLIGSIDEVAASRGEGAPRGPILPSLRSRAEAKGSALLVRPLLEAESDAVPVIAYGNDGESTFGLLLRDPHAARAEDVHAEALTNIVGQEVQVEEVPVERLRLLAVTGSFFATEKLLDPAFMRRLAARLDADLLAVGVPRRGLMFVADAAQDPALLAGMIRIVAAEFERGGSRAISTSLLLVQDGRVVGLARVRDDDDDDGGGSGDPPKKVGFFRRLFGRSS